MGDVDPDLDHRGRDQNLGGAGGETGHRRRLLRRRHLPVEDVDREVAQLAVPQPSPPRPRPPCPAVLGADDQRADDEGLAAGAQLPRTSSKAAPRSPSPISRVSTGLRPGGQLAQRGRVEVAVGGQREGPRDRRRGHVEDVRRQALGRLGVERPPLLHAEAMLLVDDANAEPGEAGPTARSERACRG